MRVAVTGGSGAIGFYVCEEFAQAGYEVVSVDRLAPRDARSFVQVDLRDLEATCAALAGFDLVIHLAAIPDSYHEAPEEVIGNNTVTSYTVFEASRRHGIPRVIYGCSDSSTGFGIHNVALKPLYVPLDEEHPLWPHESYSLSKHFGERMAQTYARAYGIETISLRYNWVWVERWRAQATQHVADARAGIFEKETAWLGGYISVRDVARACLAAAQFQFEAARTVCYEDFFLTARNTFYPVPTLDLLEAIYTQPPRVKDAAYYENDPYASVYDIRKAARLLGWQPQDAWQTFEQWDF